MWFCTASGKKIIVVFDFEKVEKISEIFWEDREDFSQEIACIKMKNLENFQKFVNRNGIKHYWWG